MEEQYGDKFVINAIAQLAMVKRRIGRVFNQSESAKIDKTVDMHEEHAQSETLYCETNNYHSHSNSTANQIINDNTRRNIHSQTKMNDVNNDNRQNSDRYTRDPILSYHWGADVEIMNNHN